MGPVAKFILRRLAVGLVTVWAISVISFIIIQLPPGDFVENYISQLSMEGAAGSEADAARMRAAYGLDDPMYVRYYDWGKAVLQGDFGRSLDWGRPVKDIIGDVLGVTVLLSLVGFVFSWLIALPIAIYCAVYRRSLGDYILSTVGIFGLAIPTFVLALAALYFGFRWFNVDLGTFQSEPFQDPSPWTAGRWLDLAKHMMLPAAIIAFPTAAGLIRLMRANLLDELGKPYVVTARAKGMREMSLILKYPTRVALNPFVSTIGNTLPQLVSGSVIVSLVMSLPTIGPILLRSLQAQDMFLASTIMLMLGVLTVIGTLLSDLLLAWLDPRIRLSG